jgi:pimeloyl-ACP methyl ester carboxylesterase
MRSKMSMLTVVAAAFVLHLGVTASATATAAAAAAPATDATTASKLAKNSDAAELHALLRSALPPELQNDRAMSMIHMLPNAALVEASEASSPKDAIQKASATNLEQLIKQTLEQPAADQLDADATLARQPITMVIVPGIFGEFIPTRAFEEVLAKPSADRDAFKKSVDEAIAKGDTNAQDSTFDMQKLGEKTVPLSDLIHVGSYTDKSGRTIARVVLFYTPFMSLESMGDLKEHAALFNRRLAKYLALTGRQKMALVGYSRGTVLGLEMLAQAQEQNLPWLAQVKAMMTLGGVTWGSSLADDVQNPQSAMHDIVEAMRMLRKEVNPDSKLETWTAEGKFAMAASQIAPRLSKHAVSPKESDLVASPVPTNLDPKSMVSMVKMMWKQMGLSHPWGGFADNVRRFQFLIDAILSGVDQLTSSSCEAWWATHTLPKNVTYYSITAAMANPDASDIEKEVFDAPYGYSKRSYDDLMLLQNHLDYQNLAGISLNDSQVSVAQAMFLPEAAARLNPSNTGLKTQMLGTVGTHHWGLALRVVNAMKDGRTNPFPREALLKALAAKVSMDLQKKKN